MPASGNVTSMERRELEAVIYEREPPIARIILNRADKANTKDAVLVTEVDRACTRPTATRRSRSSSSRPTARASAADTWPAGVRTKTRTRTSGTRSRTCTRAPPICSCGRRCICGSFPKPTISQIHGYCMGGGIYLGLLTDFCVASEDAYFQMPLAQSLGEPGGHTMIEPWLMMNWHRTMDWLLAGANAVRAASTRLGAAQQGGAARGPRGRPSRRWPARSPKSR